MGRRILNAAGGAAIYVLATLNLAHGWWTTRRKAHT
jgi:hypothetical protein